MSTDSTELTFVRCPSCRSLVPAVSTRCRMCGAGLDATAASSDEEKDKQKSSRVRQRTMSQPQSMLSSAAEKVRDESPSAEAPADKPMSAAADDAQSGPVPSSVPFVSASEREETKASPGLNIDDPLSAFVEEVSEEESPGRSGHANGRPAAAEAISEPNVQDSKSDAAREGAGGRGRVIVETGPRRKGPGLSFGKGRPDQNEGHLTSEDSARDQSREVERSEWRKLRDEGRGGDTDSRPQDRERQSDRQNRQQQSAKPSAPQQGANDRGRTQEGQGQEQRGTHVRNDARRQQQGREQHSRDQHGREAGRSAGSGVQVAEHSEGRLYGWLVSYSESIGKSYELREGKFFVTGSGLKAADFVLNHESVSTPHALISISLNDGLRAQDLMSERGLWLKRRNSDSFQRVGESARLDHGDWVRFGEVEFQVSICSAVPSRER